MRVERVILENHCDVAILLLAAVNHAAVDRKAAGANCFEPGDHAQQGRFSATRRADNDNELAIADRAADAMHDLAVAKGFAQAVEGYRGHLLPLAGRHTGGPAKA